MRILRVQIRRRREREQLLAVAAREVCDRSNHALLPEQAIRERRDVAHVDAPHTTPPPGAMAASASGTTPSPSASTTPAI